MTFTGKKVDRDMPRMCNICHRVMFSFRVDYNHYKKNHVDSLTLVEYRTLNNKDIWHNRNNGEYK